MMATEHSTIARLLAGDEGTRTLPIACRFVPFDQWLVTHIDTSWKIKDVKHWILSKCNAWGTSSAPQPPRFRPASPVTFSAPSRRSSIDSASWGETEEGEEDDWDVFAYDYNKEMRASESGMTMGEKGSLARITTHDSSSISASTSKSSYNAPYNLSYVSNSSGMNDPAMITRYVLFSFSCGHILEDEASLSWYKLQPFELLELHRHGSVVSLPRRVPAYAEQYFEAAVHVSERPNLRRTRRARPTRSTEEQMHAVEWKPKWAIIRDGVLNLCKDSTSAPSHKFPLTSISAIRGPDHLGILSKPTSRIICVKFKRTSLVAGAGADDAAPYSQAPWHPQDRRKAKPPRSSSWVVMDMSSSNAYESMLRILHRCAPHPLASSFLPSTAPTKTPTSSPIAPSPTAISPSASPFSLLSAGSIASPAAPFVPFGVQYPEWRLAVLARARLAGLGAVGPAMGQYLLSPGTGAGHDLDSEAAEFYHHLPRAPSISEGLRRQASTIGSQRSGSAHLTEGDKRDGEETSTPPWSDGAEDDDDEDDVESEVEWDGWARDIARHEARQRPPLPLPKLQIGTSTPSRNATKASAIAMSPTSPASSSDHSEAGTAGMRSRTLSFSPDRERGAGSRLAIPAVGSRATGRPGRSRSSTISASTFAATSAPAGMATMPIVGAVGVESGHGRNGTPAGPRRGEADDTEGLYMSTTTTITTYIDRFPDTSTPHSTAHALAHANAVMANRAAHRNSTLRGERLERSVSGTGGEGSSAVARPQDGGGGAMGGVRRIVRGVSIRSALNSERFVRGMESALDFVDGR